MARNELILSPAVLAEWREDSKRRRADLEREQREVLQLEQRIHAAELLLRDLGVEPESEQPRNRGFFGEEKEPSGKANAADPDSENMTAKIEEIAHSRMAPLSHDQMRAKLRSLGFPEDRLGNYYYTAVHRLKNKGRIAIGTVDKRIGPVPR